MIEIKDKNNVIYRIYITIKLFTDDDQLEAISEHAIEDILFVLLKKEEKNTSYKLFCNMYFKSSLISKSIREIKNKKELKDAINYVKKYFLNIIKQNEKILKSLPKENKYLLLEG